MSLWEHHGIEFRRDIQDVNKHDMLAYLGRNQKEVLHRVNHENKSVMKAIRIQKEVSDVSDTSFYFDQFTCTV
jgi:DNA-3-methyladenine glycosylase II